jgi:hypothetical protein
MRPFVTGLALAFALPLPVMAQDQAELELTYVMVMQFNGCSMTQADLASQMQDAGIDPATYDPVLADLVARGDATLTDEADGGKRITLAATVCEPVDMSGEWEVAEPLTPEEQLAKLQESTYVAVMASNGCSMTEAEMATVMPSYGLRQPLHEGLTEALVASGAATATAEADGSRRVALGPELCAPDAPEVVPVPANLDSVAKFTDFLLARGCSVAIPDLEAAEAELGLQPAETYPIVVVLEIAGEGRMDFENGVFRLINKDCP